MGHDVAESLRCPCHSDESRMYLDGNPCTAHVACCTVLSFYVGWLLHLLLRLHP